MKRTNDLLIKTGNLITLQKLSQFPVFFGTTKSPIEEDVFKDIHWQISQDTGMIQLGELIDLSTLYQHQTTTTAIGPTWEKHHIAFADFVKNHREGDKILEIGGAHGILAKLSLEKMDAEWVIVEPNPAPVAGCKAKFVEDFYPTSKIDVGKYKTLVHSHVLEHIYDPMVFLQEIFENIPDGGRMLFSLPNLKVWVEQKFLNALNFEHTYFAREEYIDWMLEVSGFIIDKKIYYGDGHSIFYSTLKDKPVNSQCPNLFEENKRLWNDFTDFYSDQVLKINKLMEDYANNYIFGAHIFSQYLVKIGVNEDKLKNVLDNDVNKQNKRLYGTSLDVVSPEVLINASDACVILFAGKYNQEIREQINNLNPEIMVFVGN